jgi:hypothetical protein
VAYAEEFHYYYPALRVYIYYVAHKSFCVSVSVCAPFVAVYVYILALFKYGHGIVFHSSLAQACLFSTLLLLEL